MTPQLRPPRDAEWPICRMLLPETFADTEGRKYLLCVRDEAPRVMAAVSFVRKEEAITHLRIHVVPPFRRRGIGSLIIAHLGQLGASAIEGVGDVMKEPETERFCECHGFERVEWLSTVEADLEPIRVCMERLRDRMTGRCQARIIPLSAAPMEAVARLHAEYVAQQGTLASWRWRFAQTPGMASSPVAMVDGRVVGILLTEMEGSTAVVHTRVMLPEHRGGWTSAALIHAGLSMAAERGARRTRFCYLNTNRDTEKMASRFGAEKVSVVVRFRKEMRF